MAKYEDLRQKYVKANLLEKNVPASPFELFRSWMVDAINASITEPNAMILSTVDSDLKPNSRIVLLKETTDEGFIFYTNYASSKSMDILTNPNVSLLFPWTPVERQVRINGIAIKMTEDKNREYFEKRPRGSQLGAWASPQSKIIPNREYIELQYQKVAESFAGKEKLDKPVFWGGYLVKAQSIEFWQGRDNRLHDRLKYSLNEENNWKINRLAP